MPCHCSIVPPHLLRDIAESPSNPEHVRQAAHASLIAYESVSASRREFMAAEPGARGVRVRQPSSPFIPIGVLTRLSVSDAVDEATRDQAKRDLEHLQMLAVEQASVTAADEDLEKGRHKNRPYRAVYDAKKSRDKAKLPGELIRAEGEAKVKDEDVNLVYDNIGRVLDFYKKHFKWKSIDNKNGDVISSVHYGECFQNAYWTPDLKQLVFGDGSDLIGNFTGCVDVIGHELTHAVTEWTSPLAYMDQSGALNEHIADVFGIMTKQVIENETADEADWLVGEDCLMPGGKDHQVDHMSKYFTMYEDYGGVHIFSGIPNKAFYLAATAFGGYSWDKAGQIWWKTVTCGRVPFRCNFLQFADVTVDCAEEEFGEEAAQTVRKAWNDVGVTRKV
ncbi:hypothetical protein CDD83_8065 [Cordyceps sp. RAO-2017]|nr:hypothetical protein CDD83_8065 [Cordyceps sp. RAO-2017]